jgi:hypothetical protein
MIWGLSSIYGFFSQKKVLYMDGFENHWNKVLRHKSIHPIFSYNGFSYLDFRKYYTKKI